MGELAGDRFAEVEVTDIDQLRHWLERHHAQHDGAWLITYKKAAPDKYVTHDAVLDALSRSAGATASAAASTTSGPCN